MYRWHINLDGKTDLKDHCIDANTGIEILGLLRIIRHLVYRLNYNVKSAITALHMSDKYSVIVLNAPNTLLAGSSRVAKENLIVRRIIYGLNNAELYECLHL